MIEKSVQFRTNIRDLSRQRRPSSAPADDNETRQALLKECDDYRLQMKYLGVEMKVG